MPWESTPRRSVSSIISAVVSACASDMSQARRTDTSCSRICLAGTLMGASSEPAQPSTAGRRVAPALATLELFRQRALDRIPTGPGPQAHLSFTVPGAVDAYLTMLEALGTRRVADVLAPAVQYAERGFPMYEYMHRMLAIPETREQFAVYPPGGAVVFYPGGRVPEVGALFVQSTLAGTL